MKKPMGKTGEDGDWINRCMAIEKEIMMKTHSGLLGSTSEEEGSVNSKRETENTGRGGSEGCLMELAFDLEYNEEGNPNATPAPVDIRSIPRYRFFWFYLVLSSAFPEQKMARKNVSVNQNGKGGGK